MAPQGFQGGDLRGWIVFLVSFPRFYLLLSGFLANRCALYVVIKCTVLVRLGDVFNFPRTAEE